MTPHGKGEEDIKVMTCFWTNQLGLLTLANSVAGKFTSFALLFSGLICSLNGGFHST